MHKKILVSLLVLLLIWPVLGLAKEEDEPEDHKTGQFGREVRDGFKEGFRESKKMGKEVKEGSKSAWPDAKQGFKKLWQDVKDGFGGE